MSSPFSIFRRHERLLMVVVTGLSMISFVLLGAVQDPRQMPPALGIMFLAAIVGGVAWLAGLSSGKGTEWGLSGVLVGSIIGIAISFYSREASAVVIDSGNLSANELSELRRRRYVANAFVQSAFQETFGMGLESLPPALQRQYLFGFDFSGDANTQDIVLWELLRREADDMGISISDDAVTRYIVEVTSQQGLIERLQQVGGQLDPQTRAMLSFYLGQLKPQPFTAETFTKIRTQLRVSEGDLLNALRNELKAREALELLGSNNYLPPETFWEFYKKLNEEVTADVVAIPVDSFVDESAKPIDAELSELFQQYKNNFPGETPDGQFEEGRPGFLQPRRVRLGYLEAVYDEIEALVKEPTEEEIKQRYEQQYLREVPKGDETKSESDMPQDGPSLPPLPTSDDDSQATDKAANPPKMKKPADAPKSDAPEKPADKKTPEADAKPADQPNASKSEAAPPAPEKESSSAKATDKKANEPASPEGSTPPAADEKTEPAPDKKSSSRLNGSWKTTQPVAFLQDEDAAPAKEKPAEAEKPADTENPSQEKSSGKDSQTDEKASDTPEKKAAAPAEDKSKTPETPADTAKNADKPDAKMPAKPAEKPGDTSEKDAPASEKKMPATPSAEPPPAPTSDIPPLDDTLKMELRDEILQERALNEMRKRIQAAYEFLSEMSYKVELDESAESHLSVKQANAQLEKYAEKNHLFYVVTPMLSYQELRDSEDYPIGRAQVDAIAQQQRTTVADSIFQTSPLDLYRVGQASNPQTNSSYAYWKLEDKDVPDNQPETWDADPLVREQVIQTWRRLRAQPQAEKRAEELAKIIRESDKPMPEVLGETTITGDKDSLYLTVRETGEFSWLQRSVAAPTAMNMAAPVQQTVLSAVPDAGEDFFATVFNKMKVGDVQVVPNADRTAYVIVKLKSRFPNTDEEMTKLREEFLKAGMQPSYGPLAQRTLRQYSSDWLSQLMDKHNVQILEQEPATPMAP